MEPSNPTEALSQAVADYIAERKEGKLADFDKKTASLEKKAMGEAELSEMHQQRRQERQELDASFKPANWLNHAASRAKQIRLVTHGIKYTHADAKGTSLYTDGIQLLPEGLIGTGSMETLAIDVVGNAAALDVGKLLQLGETGHKLIDYIRATNPEPLLPLAESAGQASDWLEQFKVVVSVGEPSSHKLAKQLYWPLEQGYHLLCPLFASSLAHSLYESVQDRRFGETAKEAREARKNNKPHPEPIVDYPELAVQTFGGTKPQNISQLNSGRGGQAYLFSCAPPSWESKVKAPLNIKSAIDGPFVRQEYGRIRELRSYLERHQESPRIKPVRAGRERRVEALVDQLIAFPLKYQHLEPGWSQSSDCQLPLHQKLWLDSGRYDLDEDFVYEYDKKEWQGQVADDFARMLNRLLKLGGELNMGQPEFAQWKVDVAQQVRLAKQELKEVL